MTQADRPGRANQKRRTRKALLEAAARLIRQGRKPALEEIAEEALVSRATAYRYFPAVDSLLLEASLDVAIPSAQDLFQDDVSADAVQRLDRVDATFHDMMAANEAPLRMMLVHTLQRAMTDGQEDGLPPRQNRRTPLIEAALAPARDQFTPENQQLLSRALALVIGTEAMVVFKDVLQLTDAEARAVTRFAIRALVDAARRPT
ncbi:MAG: TetR/AcrR family transcriptional regulator [Acetobacteraceae bacterium]